MVLSYEHPFVLGPYYTAIVNSWIFCLVVQPVVFLMLYLLLYKGRGVAGLTSCILFGAVEGIFCACALQSIVCIPCIWSNVSMFRKLLLIVSGWEFCVIVVGSCAFFLGVGVALQKLNHALPSWKIVVSAWSLLVSQASFVFPASADSRPVIV